MLNLLICFLILIGSTNDSNTNPNCVIKIVSITNNKILDFQFQNAESSDIIYFVVNLKVNFNKKSYKL